MILLNVAPRVVASLKKFLLFLLLALLSLLPLSAHATSATGYWLNPSASGSGFVIEIQGRDPSDLQIFDLTEYND